MLAGFQYSKQEPESLVGQGIKCQEDSAQPAPNLAPPSAGSRPGITELTVFLSAHRVMVFSSTGSLAQAFPKTSAAGGRNRARGALQLPEQAPHPRNTLAVPGGRQATQILHYTSGT